MEYLKDLVRGIPAAASNPLALVAFCVVVLAWVYVGRRTSTLKLLLATIKSLPEGDRVEAIQTALEIRLPKSMTAPQYIQFKIRQYFLIAFLATCGVIIVIVAIAAWSGHNNTQVDTLSLAKVTSQPAEYLITGQVPRGAELTLCIEGLPFGAAVNWSSPKCGELSNHQASSVRYIAATIGTEELIAEITLDRLAAKQTISFDIVPPALVSESD